jgi:uncharacterized protein (TIGR00251 family)
MTDSASADYRSWLHPRADGVLLHVLIQPRASRNQVVGVQQQALKIRVTAPPVEGAANKECLKLLADLLDASPAQLDIISGHKARRKIILIRGLPVQAILDRFSQQGIL